MTSSGHFDLAGEAFKGPWSDKFGPDAIKKLRLAYQSGQEFAIHRLLEGPIDFTMDPPGIYQELLGPLFDNNVLEPPDFEYWSPLFNTGKMGEDPRVLEALSGWRAEMCREQTRRYLSEPLPYHRSKLILCEYQDSRYILVVQADDPDNNAFSGRKWPPIPIQNGPLSSCLT